MGQSGASAEDDWDTMSQSLALSAGFPFEINTGDMAPRVRCKESITKGVGAMMIPTNDTNNLQTAIFTDRSIDFNYYPEDRESGTSLIEPPCFTHRLTQNMTVTWGS
jgi:hypothetical protein